MDLGTSYNEEREPPIPAPVRRVVIATVAPWFDTLSGPSFLNIFRDLSGPGCHVTVVLPSSRNICIKESSFSAIGSRMKRQVPVLTLFCFYWVALSTAVKERCSTLIFDFRMLPVFGACKLLLKCRGVCLISSRPVGVPGLGGWLRFLHFRLSLLLGRTIVDNFTAISPFEAMAFSTLGRIPWKRMLVIPSALGKPFVKFAWPVHRDRSRSDLRCSNLTGKKILLYHGQFHEQRGIMRVLEAFINSFRGNDEVVLLLVGSGPAKKLMQNLIEREATNVLLWDSVAYSKLPEIIACCDIGLVWLPDHPWWRYQCPTKLVELLGLGKPVIASDLPGIKWVAGNSPLVVYLRNLDADGFRKAVEEATRIKDDARSEQARREMIKRFSTESIALRLRHFVR
jgi:glycosyltransferase involved in cell wall biosynthesis